ncbi:hypothetical protein [Flavobacterium sp. 14A]|uniref:hypothetical protein n=1 Tax=Flavobacterium sp. 14A TaxID=2735896 RepID=UPI00156E7E6A|nr:hypothetical protein [Flavobacterium sp. 14A]NRT11974.1 hypothetical protein [Flavobacterium sp. 14A]
MNNFFSNFNWESFYMNALVSSIFLIISIILSIIVIPHFTLKLLKKRRKKFMSTKISYIIQELCEFIEKTPFKNKELTSQQLIIYTTKKDIKNHRFIGIIDLNILQEITRLEVRKLVLNSIDNLSPDDAFTLITAEKIRIDILKNRLETIISFHSLDIDEEIIAEVSQLCIEIRAFEIKYRYNNSMDDLIEKGLIKRTAVHGNIEISDIYKLIIDLFAKLLTLKIIDVRIEDKK